MSNTSGVCTPIVGCNALAGCHARYRTPATYSPLVPVGWSGSLISADAYGMARVHHTSYLYLHSLHGGIHIPDRAPGALFLT